MKNQDFIIFLIVAVLLFLPASHLASQDITPDSTRIDKTRLYIVLGGVGTSAVVGHFVNYNNYWDNNGKFHFMDLENEYDDALLSDKYGHLYFTYGFAKVADHAFRWTGMDTIKSAFWGSILSLGFQTYVEIQDGLSVGSPYLGFSFGDVATNIAGAAFAYYHVKEPFLRNFNLKASLRKSPNFGKDGETDILEDYESRYNWLTVNIHGFMPDSWQKWYPSFIDLAVGFSVRDIDRHGRGQHEVFLALDWNFEQSPNDSKFEKILKDFLNLYHLPAPAVQISPNVVWYGLFY